MAQSSRNTDRAREGLAKHSSIGSTKAGPPTAAFARVAAGRPPADLRWSERWPALILLAALLFVGVWPRAISHPLNQALQTLAPAVAAAPAPGAAKL